MERDETHRRDVHDVILDTTATLVAEHELKSATNTWRNPSN
jgi:hypothetical protein